MVAQIYPYSRFPLYLPFMNSYSLCIPEWLRFVLLLCISSCHSAVEVRVSRRIIEYFHFGVYGIFSELGLAHWRSWDFWFIMLLVVLLWFVRLYLHYCSQWLVLQAISVPVAKWVPFPSLTVRYLYPQLNAWDLNKELPSHSDENWQIKPVLQSLDPNPALNVQEVQEGEAMRSIWVNL